MSRYVELYRETPIRDEYQSAQFAMSNDDRDTVYVDGKPMTVEQVTRLGKWRWRMVSSGRIVADSGQGYVRRIDCVTALCGVVGARGYIHNGEVGLRYDEWITRETDQIPIHDLTRKDQE